MSLLAEQRRRLIVEVRQGFEKIGEVGCKDDRASPALPGPERAAFDILVDYAAASGAGLNRLRNGKRHLVHGSGPPYQTRVDTHR